MMDKNAVKLIQEFVHSEPRTVQDIAKHLNVNWKTAERYVQKITDEYGTLSMKQFRGNSQSSVKIVYWNSFAKSTDLVHENLSQQILSGRAKYDFYPFDLYQYSDEKLRSAKMVSTDPEKFNEKQMTEIVNGAKEELLFFSGNMSWANYKSVLEALKNAAKRGVSIKIVTRLDLATISNYQKISSIEGIEVRHREQPLRAMIADSGICQLKEVRKAALYKQSELASDASIFYVIKAREWVLFLRKVFFTMYNSAPDRELRLKALNSLDK